MISILASDKPGSALSRAARRLWALIPLFPLAHQASPQLLLQNRIHLHLRLMPVGRVSGSMLSSRGHGQEEDIPPGITALALSPTSLPSPRSPAQSGESHPPTWLSDMPAASPENSSLQQETSARPDMMRGSDVCAWLPQQGELRRTGHTD